MKKFSKKTLHRGMIYVLVFLFTLHITPATYINSSFLSQFIPEKHVGLIWTIGSLFTFLAFLSIRNVLKKFGNYKTFLAVLLLEFITLIILSIPGLGGSIAIPAYIIGFIMRNLAFFHLDIFLEDSSTDKETGSIRGFYLTMLNLSFLIGPLIGSFLITDAEFWKVYLMSGLILIPSILITVKHFAKFKDPKYQKFEFFKTLRKVWNNKNIHSVFAAQLLLRFFYSWMIIYTPLYLNQHIGFSIAETTLIIGIALIAFVISQGPLGYLADKYIGEQEILISGFSIMAISTAAMSFIHTPNLIIWIVVLFVTRIGASMVEIMSEVYFFKKIKSSDVNILSTFRMTRPVVYMISPLLASILLIFLDIKFLFLLLGIIMIYGIRYSITLKDTL